MGSGNVFADLGLPDADKLKIKSGLVIEITKARWAYCSRPSTMPTSSPSVQRNDQRPRTDPPIEGPVLGRRVDSAPVPDQVPNSGRRVLSCDWSRWMIDECICETRDSLRSSVAPISFIVSSS